MAGLSNMLRRCLLCLVAGALLAGCGSPEPRQRPGGARPSADVVEGKRLYDELRYREAEVSFRRALAAEPQDEEVLDYLTRLELLTCVRRDLSPAADMRRVSIEAEKAELRRLFEEGEALLDAGDLPRAITRFELALEKIKWFPYKLDDEGWKERAEECLAAARAVQPQPPRAPRPRVAPVVRELPTLPDFVAGLRHNEAFDYRQATDCFTRASEADPGNEEIRRYLLQAQLLVGDRVAEFETLEERLR